MSRDYANVPNSKNNLLSSTTIGNVTETFTYNAYGELASQTASVAGVPFVTITYDDLGSNPRDPLGRVKRMTQTIKPVSGSPVTTVTNYQYDARDRLLDVNQETTTEHYGYDDNGNRTSVQTASASFVPTYDDQDRLLTYGSDVSFTYTLNGEVLTKTVSGQQSTYGYDPRGSLLSVQTPSNLIEYIVDGLGRRVAKKQDGTLLKRWIYRGMNPVAELDATGAIIAQFVYATKSNIPELVVRGTKVYRLVSDQLGSPLYAINIADSTDVPFRAKYSASGVMTILTGFGWIPFGFAGGMYDLQTKLLRFGARDYDPSIGRWMAKDPIRFEGRQANLYVYTGNDPVNRTDPLGLDDGTGGAAGLSDLGGERWARVLARRFSVACLWKQ